MGSGSLSPLITPEVNIKDYLNRYFDLIYLWLVEGVPLRGEALEPEPAPRDAPQEAGRPGPEQR